MSLRVKAVCDRCGFVVRLRSLKKEWTGYRVCRPCYDPRPAHLNPPNVRGEGAPIPNARPEPEPIFRDPDELGGEDL